MRPDSWPLTTCPCCSGQSAVLSLEARARPVPLERQTGHWFIFEVREQPLLACSDCGLLLTGEDHGNGRYAFARGLIERHAADVLARESQTEGT